MVSRTRKLRGSRTHGRGKKHGRGAGGRGGTGNAGLHKHKFKWMIKYDPEHFGPRGFFRHAQPHPTSAIDLEDSPDGSANSRPRATRRRTILESMST